MHDTASLNFRTVELHEYGVGGNLSDFQHYDAGSLLTIDLMLSKSGNGEDFEGGEFICPVHAHHNDDEGLHDKVGSLEPLQVQEVEDFDLADMLIFPSHKYHNVKPITRGVRTVMGKQKSGAVHDT
eukprot:SAG31_NODE_146_length_22601_cov_56.529192_2_plen_126_part_00